MSLYNIGPYFGIIALLLLVFSCSPVFKAIDEAPSKNRMHVLDGLRGFLALSVFIHHGVIMHDFVQHGTWLLPPFAFYGLLGQVAVAFFFMISGFLFWGKLIREKQRINWMALYIGRIFRIGPIYLVVVLAMFIIVFARTGWTLHEPLDKATWAMLRWMGLGLFGKPDINGYVHTTLLILGAWSLYFEWLFYFSLRITYYAAIRKNKLTLVLAGWGISLIATFIFRGALSTYIALFFSGMTAATLIQEGYKPKIDARIGALAALACVTLVFLCFREVHNGLSLILLAIPFFILCSGNSLFGLLTMAAAQRLGHISYGIYLLQGPVLAVFYASDVIKSFCLISDAYYWLSLFLCSMVLTALASALYVLIERPGIMLGRKLGKQASKALAHKT